MLGWIDSMPELADKRRRGAPGQYCGVTDDDPQDRPALAASSVPNAATSRQFYGVLASAHVFAGDGCGTN
jgi:hypothetical protein